MPVDIFHNSTKSLPKSDSQIIRIPLDQLDLGGRKSHIPQPGKSENMAISHVPNAGSKT